MATPEHLFVEVVVELLEVLRLHGPPPHVCQRSVSVRPRPGVGKRRTARVAPPARRPRTWTVRHSLTRVRDMDDQIDQVRRFNRVLTQRIGALSEEYLGRSRPLGASRVLWEIGPDGADV